MSEEEGGKTRWDFYALCLKVGLVVATFGALFLLARKGDVASIVVLSSLGVLALVGTGAWVVIAILDRQAQAEQRRFTANLKENLIYMDQIQKVQNRQLVGATRANRDLLAANRQLAGMLPDRGLDVDALLWDQEAEIEGGW
jgi:hypothetical protein